MVQQDNDSLFVGISFMPREIVVELIDTNNECIRGVVDFPLDCLLHHIQDRLSANILKFDFLQVLLVQGLCNLLTLAIRN